MLTVTSHFYNPQTNNASGYFNNDLTAFSTMSFRRAINRGTKGHQSDNRNYTPMTPPNLFPVRRYEPWPSRTRIFQTDRGIRSFSTSTLFLIYGQYPHSIQIVQRSVLYLLIWGNFITLNDMIFNIKIQSKADSLIS